MAEPEALHELVQEKQLFANPVIARGLCRGPKEPKRPTGGR